jgi:hypothetical protein
MAPWQSHVLSIVTDRDIVRRGILAPFVGNVLQHNAAMPYRHYTEVNQCCPCPLVFVNYFGKNDDGENDK